MQSHFILSAKVERILFYFVVLTTTLFLFYPPYLPMVDLPQHAAQVATLNDLLHGQSPWVDLVVLNWDTPYLAGYGLWLLLYQFMSITLSAKVLVALIFLFYTYAIHQLRKSFQASVILEWVAMTSFFGFAFQWGFITFLLAAPVGIVFFLYGKKWLERKQRKDLIIFILLGVAMYFCHVLIFAFFCFLSYGYFLLAHAKIENWKTRMLFSAPYLLYAVMLGRYVVKPNLWAFRYYDQNFVFEPLWYKLEGLLYYPWNMSELYYYNLACIVILIAPPLLGFRLRRQIGYYAPLIAFLVIYFAMPHIGFQTGFLYQRFALFFVPFYYLVWEMRLNLGKLATNIQQLTFIFFTLSVGLLMWKMYHNQILFAQDANLPAYQKISQAMQPEKRVLTLHSPTSRDTQNGLTSMMEYLYFPNWYQAEKRGWTDFNFASFHPQIVRYHPEKLHKLPSRSATKEGIEKLSNCADYDYLLMKTDEQPENIAIWLANNPACQSFKLVANHEEWLLFQQNK